MRYGIIEDHGWYWVVDNIIECYLEGPFRYLWEAEGVENEYQTTKEAEEA